MTSAIFKTKDGVFCGLTVKGHSGYAGQGSDIVCAAVSSMVNLTVRLLEQNNEDFTFTSSPEKPEIQIKLNAASPYADQALRSLYCELRELSADYKGFVKASKQEIK